MTNPPSAWKRAKRINFREQVLKNLQNVERQRHELRRLRQKKDINLEFRRLSESKRVEKKESFTMKKAHIRLERA